MLGLLFTKPLAVVNSYRLFRVLSSYRGLLDCVVSIFVSLGNFAMSCRLLGLPTTL